jgi:gamma-glutamyl-gamma-aminobutyrate hydrolase PuuD
MFSFAITPRFFETKIDRLISVEQKYYPFFEKFNSIVNLIPFSSSSIEKYLDIAKPDGVIFAGGYRMYTEEIREFEYAVMKHSLDRKIPILAICCGMWTVNSYFNGTLKFNENHQAFVDDKIDIKKMIHFVNSKDLIEQGNYKVNSFHSKVIDKLGENLNIFLEAHDGEIEGIYNLEKKIIGVQFHMENKGVSENLTKQIMNKFFGLIRR